MEVGLPLLADAERFVSRPRPTHLVGEHALVNAAAGPIGNVAAEPADDRGIDDALRVAAAEAAQVAAHADGGTGRLLAGPVAVRVRATGLPGRVVAGSIAL